MSPALDGRVLALTPTSKDASLTRELLATAGIEVCVCARLDALLEALDQGAGAVVIPEEVMSVPAAASLRAAIARQPPWSDLPVLVLARQGANSSESGDAVRTLGNVTLLERPVRRAALLSAVSTALRARERQYQIRTHLAERARAEESLRLADQRKDEFLATLGHELRNPLAPLLTGLQLLKASEPEVQALARITTVMERQVSHLVRLVDDLLEVSRITRGLTHIQREPLDLVALLRSVVEANHAILDAAGHELLLDLPARAIPIAGDGVRLAQVFANLLTNAAKYTHAGGHVWLALRRDGEHARVSVRDDGIGIPPAHLGSVFDMFMQVDRSSRQAQGGLGIGLTLVRTLVHMHGGRVEARSDGAGRGSEFIVELPVLAQDVVAAPAPEELRPFAPCRVLVVDDNADAGDMLGALLTTLDVDVRVVNSGQRALDALAGFVPDAVLLDIGMPEMDGYEVARRIRAMPGSAGVVLIALTGWGQDQDQQQSRAAGFDHHLVKPPDIDKLRDLLASACQPRVAP